MEWGTASRWSLPCGLGGHRWSPEILDLLVFFLLFSVDGGRVDEFEAGLFEVFAKDVGFGAGGCGRYRNVVLFFDCGFGKTRDFGGVELDEGPAVI